jgi:predicted dehydrogenase
MKAGAHVYVEKPTAHSIDESRAMVKTARECGVVVQVGLHRRIGPHHVNAMKFLREGKLGKIGTVRLFVSSKGGKEAPKANAEVPQGLDWDFYCGPAPLRKFNQKIHPGGWRNFLDFSNGQIGDWGVHWLDQALWWSEEKAPKRVFSSGGRPLSGAPVNTDAEMSGDAPEDQTAVFEFENFTAIWENRRYGDNNAEKHKLGAYFYGTEGTLHIGWRDGWTFYPANEKKPMVHEDSQLQEPDGHNIQLLWADFLEAIEKKRPATANLEAAHRSSVLPMLAMISLQTKSSLDWDGEQECITNNAAAQKLLRRNYRGPWVHPEV